MKIAVVIASVMVVTIALSTVAIYFAFPHAKSDTTSDIDWDEQSAYIGCMCFNEPDQQCTFHTCSERTSNEKVIIGGGVKYPGEKKVFEKIDKVRAVEVGDLNLDGWEDIVACGRGESDIFVFTNHKGNGASFTLQTLIQESVCDTCRDLHLVDIDNDGDLDVAFASQETSKLGWFENPTVPRDGVTDWVNHVVVRNATKVAQFRVADINGDGLLDWVAASFCEGDCGIPCDNIPPEMMADIAEDSETTQIDMMCQAAYPPPTVGYDSYHAWIQVSPDVYEYTLLAENKFGAFGVYIEEREGEPATIYGAVRNAEGSTGSIIKFDLIDGVWVEEVLYAEGEYGLMGPDYLMLGDVNLDGSSDLLVASREGDGLAWLEENSSGEWVAHDIAYRLMDGPKHLDIADVDGDGDLDLTAGGFFDDTFNWFENPTVPSAATEANGGKWVQYKLNQCNWGPSVSVFADLDHDGKYDIIGASMDDGKLSWWSDVYSMTSPEVQFMVEMQGVTFSTDSKKSAVINRIVSM